MATGFPIIFGLNKRPWTPALISTAAWFDAADANTLTLNGSTVSQWNDKSGNAINVSQATASNQPTYQATGINGKPILSFDGTNDFLVSSANCGLTGNVLFAIYAVMGMTLPTGDVFISFGTAAIGNSFGYFGSNSGNGVTFSYSTGVQSGTATLPTAANHVISLVRNAATTTSNYALRQNGSAVTVTQGNNTAPNLINAPVNIGRWVAGGLEAPMTCAELIITQGTTTQRTIESIEGYLAWKWGLEGNLPSTHPYKLLPPTA